jgi:hypothetical protein
VSLVVVDVVAVDHDHDHVHDGMLSGHGIC